MRTVQILYVIFIVILSSLPAILYCYEFSYQHCYFLSSHIPITMYKGRPVKRDFQRGERRGSPSTPLPDSKPVDLSPFRGPASLSTKQTPMRKDPFLGEDVLGTDFGLGGGTRIPYVRKFCNHYGGYVDLVEAQYQAMAGVDTKSQKAIPQCLFNYYCYTALWRRIISVLSVGSDFPPVLRSELERLENLGTFMLPEPLIRYLQGIGHFTDQKGVVWHLTVPFDLKKFTEYIQGHQMYGGLPIGTSTTNWVSYLSHPIPCVYTKAINALLYSQTQQPVSALWLPPINPDVGANGKPETLTIDESVLGWKPLAPEPLAAFLSIQSLKWTPLTVPPDCRDSCLNLSPSTILWMHQRMQTAGKLNVRPYTMEENSQPSGSPAQLVYADVGSVQARDPGLSISALFNPSLKCCMQLSVEEWRLAAMCRYSLFIVPISDYEYCKAHAGCGWYWWRDDVKSGLFVWKGFWSGINTWQHDLAKRNFEAKFLIPEAYRSEHLTAVVEAQTAAFRNLSMKG